MNQFDISVIICTHNGANRIKFTLDALAKQRLDSFTKYEIIVVNNASTDDTEKIVVNYWASVSNNLPLKIINEPKKGKSNALITGYNAAEYELMVLCDDDNWLHHEYLKNVTKIFNEHSNIGLLGGYGIAKLDNDENKKWFDKWQEMYVCGKHHNNSGFLNPLDNTIWGAGSVMRKTMWNFLISNGFKFNNSLSNGKAITEDAELSTAITFTGHNLYFDDRLTFTHDLRGGRVSWNNLIDQQKLNGRSNAVIYSYGIAYKITNGDNRLSIKLRYTKLLLYLFMKFSKSFLKPKNKPRWIYFQNIFMEIAKNLKKYESLSFESKQWIEKINNRKPLDN